MLFSNRFVKKSEINRILTDFFMLCFIIPHSHNSVDSCCISFETDSIY